MRVETEREADGRWIGEVPNLPGVLAYGATESEARSKALALALRVLGETHAWCAATTKPLAEHIAAAALGAAGYQAWVPLYHKRLRGNRVENGRRIRSRTDTFGPRPLFLGYCFVLVPHDSLARDIDHTPGVHHLIRYAPENEFTWGKPKRIRWRVMQQLRDAVDGGIWEDEHGSLRTGAARPLSPGSRVRTPAGIVAVVLSLDDKGRADLLADILGGGRVIRGVDARQLEFVE